MAKLQMQLDSLEGLDEATSSLYIEKDGKFFLDVDGHDKNVDQKNMIPKSRLDQEIDKRKVAEGELQTVADNLKEDIPEEFKDLIPDLPPAKLIIWIRSANAKGLFDPKAKESPDKKRPEDQKPKDLSGLSPQAMMAQGYKTK